MSGSGKLYGGRDFLCRETELGGGWQPPAFERAGFTPEGRGDCCRVWAATPPTLPVIAGTRAGVGGLSGEGQRAGGGARTVLTDRVVALCQANPDCALLESQRGRYPCRGFFLFMRKT